MELHPVRARDRKPALAWEHGHGWCVDAETEWIVEAPLTDALAIAAALPPRIARCYGSTLVLQFGNAVGRISAGPLGTLVVNSGKWSERDHDAMLDSIASEAAGLPFDSAAATSMPYHRAVHLLAPDVLLHGLLWLRHALAAGRDHGLLGALRSIVENPHRRLVPHSREVPVELASTVSARTLDDICEGRLAMQSAPPGRGVLGLLPVRVGDRVSRHEVDNAENRFVKAFLIECDAMVGHMQAVLVAKRPHMSSWLQAACEEVRTALAPVQRASLWREVGPLVHFAISSPVLQRRRDYREVLRHFLLLRASSHVLPLHADEILQLLAVKDIARLYELWCGFALLGVLRSVVGPPTTVRPLVTEPFGVTLRRGVLATWPSGLSVAFNPTYSRTSGWHGRSRSLELRPDFVLGVPRGTSIALHAFDAKFRRDTDGSDEASAKASDIHKMHAYRDAIPELRSAWALYPGTITDVFGDDGDYWCGPTLRPPPVGGVGALPLQPGVEPGALRCVVSALLGQ